MALSLIKRLGQDGDLVGSRIDSMFNLNEDWFKDSFDLRCRVRDRLCDLKRNFAAEVDAGHGKPSGGLDFASKDIDGPFDQSLVVRILSLNPGVDWPVRRIGKVLELGLRE